jgi:hypothetical protein
VTCLTYVVIVGAYNSDESSVRSRWSGTLLKRYDIRGLLDHDAIDEAIKKLSESHSAIASTKSGSGINDGSVAPELLAAAAKAALSAATAAR